VTQEEYEAEMHFQKLALLDPTNVVVTFADLAQPNFDTTTAFKTIASSYIDSVTKSSSDIEEEISIWFNSTVTPPPSDDVSNTQLYENLQLILIEIAKVTRPQAKLGRWGLAVRMTIKTSLSYFDTITDMCVKREAYMIQRVYKNND
jgi:hypothetical protein